MRGGSRPGCRLGVVSARTATVVVNPEAGRHDTDRTLRTIAAGLERAGIEADLRTTERASDTKAFAREAVERGADLVVVAGGDGTVMGAVGALVHTNVPLLPLPLGTWNGLVRMLGAPVAMAAALEACLAGSVIDIDVGHVPELDHHYLLWAGAGVDAEIMASAGRERKKRWGYWAYLGALAERLGGSRNRRLILEIDGVRHEFHGHTVLSFNVNDLRFVGLPVGPVVDPHDGKMDLTVLTRPGLWGSLGEVLRVLTSGEPNGQRTWLEAREARIDAEPPLDVQADGEVIGTTPLTLRVLPKALALQAPKGYVRTLAKRRAAASGDAA